VLFVFIVHAFFLARRLASDSLTVSNIGSSRLHHCDKELIEEYKQLPRGSGHPKTSSKWEEKCNLLRKVVKRSSGELEIVMLGDSIVEFLAGGSGQLQGFPRVPGAHEVWKHEVGNKHNSALLGSAGDRAANLLYRLSHGEFPKGTVPRAIIVHIGINDVLRADKHTLGSPQALDKFAKKLAGTVMASVALLHHLSRCSSKIVVLGLMPCGSIAPKAGAPHAYDWPSVYAGAIAAANRQIKARVERHPSLQFLDCGRLLLTQNGTAVSRELTIDGLHPSAGGYHALLSRCILPGISRILSP